jgi:hypothetical protein
LYNRDPYWLLDFAKNKTKLSYAASIEGWNNVETFSRNDMNFFKKHLADFAGISLRESGTTALFRSFGVNAKHVLDPTLLKDTNFYDNLARPASIPDYHGEPFVLCYFVKESGYVKAKIADYCRRKAFRMVLLPHLQGGFSIEDDKYKETHVYGGPREFLWLLKNCELVFATSYHGTCLSILYRKQFCAFQPGLENMKKSSNFDERVCQTRLGSLLSLTGLLDRCFDIEQFPDDGIIINPIDYTAVESILSEQRNYSMEFLRDGLLGGYAV